MRLLLLPVAIFYWLIVRFRNLLFDLKILKSSKPQLPTIVVGNITVGGTGKTPFIIYISKLLRNSYQLALLSRGYKRKTKSCIIVTRSSTPEQVGDEPWLLFHSLNLPTVVCADRLKGINLIKQRFPRTQLVILDDGFQHRRLQPHLTILLIDCTRPIEKDWFLPAGNLRDNVYRLRHAQIFVFTKCSATMPKAQAQKMIKRLKLKAENCFFTYYKPQKVFNPATGEELSLEQLKKYKILAFSGLGNNKNFQQTVLSIAPEANFFEFPDHHFYTLRDLKKIFYTFAKIHSNQKLILTTEKDYVKLAKLLSQEQKAKIYVLSIQIRFLYDGEQKFNKKIYSYGRKLVDQD